MAFDAFLKLDNVAGESTDAGHKGEIEVLGYNFNVSHPTNRTSAGSGAGAGKATFTDFSLITPVSKASPVLFVALTTGHVYKQAIVSLRKAGTGGKAPTDFLRITMSSVVVSSMSSGGSTADAAPHDQVTLSYLKIQFAYAPQNPDGSSTGAPVTGGWDVVRNTPA